MTLPVVLTIAGSDPSGGAGIQADLRTFGALGVVGLSVITALTVQNSQGVQSVHPVPADVLAAQLEAVFRDTRFDAVKIGMLGGAAQVRAVADTLRRYCPPNVVLDPVLASTGGVPLLDDAGRQALLSELFPLCNLVTPNVPELAVLTGMPTQQGGERRQAVLMLQSLGTRVVLVKGGHLPKDPVDRLFQGQDAGRGFWASRVETPHTHGTGCLLSSAIAALLAKGKSLVASVETAKSLISEALTHPVMVGQGRGYPDIEWGVQELRPRPPFFRTHSDRLKLLSGLYVVTDSELRPERGPEEIAWAALDGGAGILQLRDKRMPIPRLVALAQKLRSVTFPKMLFIINDRVDIALASYADGVHLGPDDIHPEDARRLVGPEKLVGVSVSTVEEAAEAAPWASYFGVGAVFGTQTKADAGAAIGVGRIKEIKAAFPQIPIVAIGGINTGNIGEVARAGADAAAVVSAVVGTEDMAEAVKKLMQIFMSAKRQIDKGQDRP